jgi:hypothetical protein
LLARVEVEQRSSGWVAKVPAVAERPPPSKLDAENRSLYGATPAAEVEVAGGFPWLRQGWARLDDDFRAPFRKLHRFAKGLTHGMFTTFNPMVGAELATLISKGEI